jgi:prevent-host-death family protein
MGIVIHQVLRPDIDAKMSNMVDTKFVGVRELKQTAPDLVRRAARGERIVITRYGRPAALLTELGPSASIVQSAQRLDWESERAAFTRLAPGLSKRVRGKYIAVSGGKVVGSDADHDRLYRRMLRRLGGRVFFIGRVGGAAPVVEMPGFEIE